MLGSRDRTARSKGGVIFRFGALAVTGFALSIQDVVAQAPTTTYAPTTTTYTPAQANAGAAVYQARCAMCHLPTMAGSPMAPALAGPAFRSAWGARPVGQLLSEITTTMPPNARGTLTAEEVTGVVAYLLSANEVSPNGIALTTSTVGPVIPGFVPPEPGASAAPRGGTPGDRAVASPPAPRGQGDNGR